MPNSIILKAKAVSELDEYSAFSVALALNDGTKDIAATFSIDSEAVTLPMIGVTEYGKLVGLVTDDSTAFTVTATPLDGSAATEADTTVADVIGADIGDSIASA